MRLVAGALTLALFAPLARAEDTTTAQPARSTAGAPAADNAAHGKLPLRVIQVMPESRQALLFDRARATHVLAEIGVTLDGYTVDDIDDDAVTLSRDGQQIVLAAPPRTNRHHRREAVHVRSAAARASDTGDPTPLDPTPLDPTPLDPTPLDPTPLDPTPLDPYMRSAPAAHDAASRRVELPAATAGGAVPASAVPVAPEPGVRVVRAPDASAAPAVVPGEGGIRIAEAPGTAPIHPAPTATAPRVAEASRAAAVVPGEGGIRIAEAPGTAPAAAPSTPAATRATAVVPGEGRIRIAEAPGAAPAAAPSTPATTAARVTAASGAARAAPPAVPGEGGIRVVAAPELPAADSPVGSVPVRTAEAPTAPAPIAAPTREARTAQFTSPATPPATPPAAPRSPAVTPSGRSDLRATDAVRAPDQQTLDARALAEVMTGDHRTRGPRGPRIDAPAAAAAAVAHVAPATPAASPPAASPPGDAIAISRGDLDRALADFAGLTAAVHGSFSGSGVAIESVADGAIFQRAGLRAGDLVTAVDGVGLRSLDDAADLYARASAARAMTVQLVRGGKPVTLHLVIQ